MVRGEVDGLAANFRQFNIWISVTVLIIFLGT